MKCLAFILLVGACAHGTSSAPTLRNVGGVACPTDEIVVELPTTQHVSAVAELVAETKSLSFEPTSSDAVSVIRERIADFDQHDNPVRRCK